MPKVRHCIDCGAVVEGRSWRCPECKARWARACASTPARREQKRLVRIASMAIPKPRTCKHCGIEFVAAGYVKVCPECAEKLSTRHRGKAYAASNPKTRKCMYCGRPFEGTPKAVVCPKCKEERAEAREQERAENAKPKMPNNIAANMEAAKAAGMGYGEYMTLKTLGRL